MSKYGAISTDKDGYHFDSLAEARRYQELMLLERADTIHNLQIHPVYVIWEHCNPTTHKRETIKYEADFAYQEGGAMVVEDVKGGTATQTAVFRLKAKMFRAKYPDIDFRIVEG